MSKAAVTVLALGGTIAMTRTSDGAGVVPTMTGAMLVAAVPALTDYAEVDARSFRQMPGAHLQITDLEALAAEIRQVVAGGARGVVITQGTDTIEETAFVLDRLLDIDAPVVVTGAMRNPTLPGADGPANLLASVLVAISDEARGKGVLVVLNDEIHAARFVRKMHTSSVGAFTSPLSGPLGWVGENRVRLPLALPAIAALAQAKADAAAVKVPVVTIGLGDDGTMIDAAIAAGIDGLVVEATGGGHVAPAVADALERAAASMPVILATRTGTGEVLNNTYGFPGGEIDLQRRGLLRAGWLDGLKARLLLILALRNGTAQPAGLIAALKPFDGGPLA